MCCYWSGGAGMHVLLSATTTTGTATTGCCWGSPWPCSSSIIKACHHSACHTQFIITLRDTHVCGVHIACDTQFRLLAQYACASSQGDVTTERYYLVGG